MQCRKNVPRGIGFAMTMLVECQNMLLFFVAVASLRNTKGHNTFLVPQSMSFGSSHSSWAKRRPAQVTLILKNDMSNQKKRFCFEFFVFFPLSVEDSLLWISKPLSGDFALQDLPPVHCFSLPLLSPISTATKLSAQEANTGIIAISGYSFAMPTKHVSLERLWFKNNPIMLNSHFVSCSLIYPHNILRINCGTVEYHKLAVHLLPAFTGMILHWARIDNHRVMPSCIWCPEHFELIWIEHIWVTHWTDMSEINLTSWLVNQKTVSCWHLLGALDSSFRSNMINEYKRCSCRGNKTTWRPLHCQVSPTDLAGSSILSGFALMAKCFWCNMAYPRPPCKTTSSEAHGLNTAALCKLHRKNKSQRHKDLPYGSDAHPSLLSKWHQCCCTGYRAKANTHS